MAYKDVIMMDDDQMINILEESKKLGTIVMAHAENGTLVARA